MRRLLTIQNLSMSSNKKKGVPATQTKDKPEQKSDEGPLKTDKFGNICIKILAKPGAKQNSITEVSNDGIVVQIAAPPSEGEANAELVRYLSKVLHLRKSDLSLDKGSRSRNKIILVNKGVITESIVIDLLSKECES